MRCCGIGCFTVGDDVTTADNSSLTTCTYDAWYDSFNSFASLADDVFQSLDEISDLAKN